MKKRLSIISFLTILIFLIVPGIVMADIWESCPYGEEDCTYPGDCRRYIDTNSDGICDRSQPSPETAISIKTQNDNVTTASLNNNTFSIDDPVDSGIKPAIKHSKDRLYHLVPILLILSIMYGLTYFLSAKGIIRLVTHRKLWNFFLLATFLISAILGLFLILSIDFDIDVPLFFDALYWHVEIGIAMGIIAAFHVFWHWRYFTKMIKLKS